MSKRVNITDMGGETTDLRCNDTEKLIIEIKKNMGIYIDCYNLFYKDYCITTSKKKMDTFELEDGMELMIIKSDTPIRILDETVIKKEGQCWNIEKIEETFCPIEEWDVSFVSDMTNVFRECRSFDRDISGWDTSNVSDMTSMFDGASSFNQYIGDWDTSNVQTMECMFADASSFNQYIGDWDTRKVKNMWNMFDGASSFNQYIGDWKTHNVYFMGSMFDGASSFNQDISNWDTSKVVNMSDMFFKASSFNQDISNWDTSKVVNMSDMFEGVIYLEEMNAPFYDFNTYNRRKQI